MAWSWTGNNKQLPEPMMAQLIDEYESSGATFTNMV